MQIHIVSAGETIAAVADLYGVSADRLIYDNQLGLVPNLIPGQALLILQPEIVYTVRPGDSLYGIAENFGVTVLKLLQNNPFLLGEETLAVGQSIVISYTDQPQDIMRVGGYAYPFVRDDILREVLLYLSEYFAFSYGFTPEGELIPEEDWRQILLARQFGVPVFLVLTPREGEDIFNSNLVHIIASDAAVRAYLIENLLFEVQDKGYAGVDVDFEYVPAEDAAGFVAFVSELRQRLNPFGYQVSVALAPKTSADQPGLLYEGMDYLALGAAADFALLMTYEWGYKYGPPLAVAPIPNVRRVVEYAVSEIPPEKLRLGIPNYAYDWPLPYIKGETVAETIGNIEALRIAAENGAEIQFDEQAQSPYFEYVRDGVGHVVWFEDVRSILAKLQLAQEYNLSGVGFWNLLREFRPAWLLLNNFTRIEGR